MSDRSLFPEGVAVHQRHLENESDQRIADVTRIVSGQSSTGVVSGLVVSVNPGDGTKIDVTAGSAFSPAGSYMTLGTGRTGLTLALNTLGAKNYVLLVYDEAQSDQESHTSDGTLRYTKATNSPRVIVLTDSAYAALPPSDSVLSNNARDRATILAVITATGGVLSATDIASPPSFSPVLGATIQNTLPGVTALLIGAGTNTGTGSLYWDGSGFLTWTAPGDTAGTPVAVSTSQAYTLTSGGGYTFKVDIAFSVLPITAATANVTVYDVYSQTASRMSLKDSHHRSLVGSGTPSANNPHGMTLDDLSPGAAGSLEEHQDVMHTDGIGRGSSNGLLAVTVNTGPVPDSMTIAGFSTGDSAYINGRRVTAIVGSNTIAAPVTASMTTEQVYISQDGTVGTRSFAVHGTLDLINRIQILNLVGVPSGTCQIRYTNTGAISLSIGGTFGPAIQAPSVDGLIRVSSVNTSAYADLWVKSGSAPGATITETITVSNPSGTSGIMVVATVPWSGSASGFLGYGHGINNAPNGTYDLRVRGTLDISNVSSTSGIGQSNLLGDIAMSDGFIYQVRIPPGTVTDNSVSFAAAQASQHVLTTSGLQYSFTGGMALLGGKVVNVASVANVALVDNTITRIYVNSSGDVVSTSVLGWGQIASDQLGKPYLRVAQVTTSGGVVTTSSDMRVFTGYRRNQPYGVVGIGADGEASVATAAAASALSAVNTAVNGVAMLGIASGSNGIGVLGSGTTGSVGVGALNNLGVALRSTGRDGSTFYTTATSGAGVAAVYGEAHASHADGIGVQGVGGSNGTPGVYGVSTSPFLTSAAVSGNSQNGTSVKAFMGTTTAFGFSTDMASNVGGAGLNVASVGANVGIRITGVTSGAAMYALSGDVKISSSNNYTYDGVVSATQLYDASHFQYTGSASPTPVMLMTGNGTSVWQGLTGANYTLLGKILLPVGSTITGIRAAFLNNDTNPLLPFVGLAKLTYVNDTTTLGDALVTGYSPSIPKPNTTYWYASSAISEVIAAGAVYVLRVDMPACTLGANFTFYGMRVSYTYSKLTGAMS